MEGIKTSLIRVLLNGILKKCPNCSKGKIFSRYLSINKYCSHCNEHLSIYRTDDFGPWLSIVLAGHIVVPLVLSAEQTFAPPLWLQAIIWIPFSLFVVACGLLNRNTQACHGSDHGSYPVCLQEEISLLSRNS